MVEKVLDILGLDTLVAEMVLGIGLAVLVGNGLALWRHHKGRASPNGHPLRTGRVTFLVTVGVIMVVAGLGSLLR